MGKVPQKSLNDIVIVGMARTALTKAKRGLQKDTAPEVMLSTVLRAVVQQAGIEPKLVEDVCVGNALQPGAGGHTSRMATFIAGFPETTSLSAVNRQCSSGLQSVMNIAHSIMNHQIEIGIGAGVESMSLFSMEGVFDPNVLS